MHPLSYHYIKPKAFIRLLRVSDLLGLKTPSVEDAKSPFRRGCL